MIRSLFAKGASITGRAAALLVVTAPMSFKPGQLPHMEFGGSRGLINLKTGMLPSLELDAKAEAAPSIKSKRTPKTRSWSRRGKNFADFRNKLNVPSPIDRNAIARHQRATFIAQQQAAAAKAKTSRATTKRCTPSAMTKTGQGGTWITVRGRDCKTSTYRA
jgi:hypothetical protein